MHRLGAQILFLCHNVSFQIRVLNPLTLGTEVLGPCPLMTDHCDCLLPRTENIQTKKVDSGL